MLHDVVVGLKDRLLSPDRAQREDALEELLRCLEEDARRTGFDTSLDYVFEFLLGRVKAEDCLEISKRILQLILKNCGEREHIYAGDLTFCYSRELPVASRVCILELLCGRCCPDITKLLNVFEGERDPKCLMSMFDLIISLDIPKDAIEPLFEALSVYFPITFRSHQSRLVQEEDLRQKLRGVMAVVPEMTHLSLPFLNERLSSATSSTVVAECVKALGFCYPRAEDDALVAYYRESCNLVFSCLSREIEDVCAKAIFDFLGGAFIDSKIYGDYLKLVSDHILFGFADRTSKLVNYTPSIIRCVAGASGEATGALYKALLPQIEGVSGIAKETKLEWSCLLALLCAQSESGNFVFRDSHDLLQSCARIKAQVLEEGTSREDLLLGLSFMEAVLRDEDALGNSEERLQWILALFQAIEDRRRKIDGNFARMIAKSVVKHQSETILERVTSFTEFMSATVLEALMDNRDLSIKLITSAISENKGNLRQLLATCELDKVSDDIKPRWIYELDKSCCHQEAIDLLILYTHPDTLLSNYDTYNPNTRRLVALAMPASLSSIDLLQQFPDDPECKAALVNKHGVDVDSVSLPDPVSRYCVARALLLLQDNRVFDMLSIWSDVDKSKLLSDDHSKVNTAHGFVVKPLYKQWLVERALISDLFDDNCRANLLCSCPEQLQALDLNPLLSTMLSRPAVTPSTIKLLDTVLSVDSFLLKDNYKRAIESLTSTAVTCSAAAVRYSALSCLKSMLEVLSGSAVLPFIPEFVAALRPALGDPKAAVRHLAVDCTSILYSFYV